MIKPDGRRGRRLDVACTYERRSVRAGFCIVDLGYEAARFGIPRYRRVNESYLVS